MTPADSHDPHLVADSPSTVDREALVWFLWMSTVGLPAGVLIVRTVCGYSGWMTAFVLVTYAPILLVSGVILATSVHLATRGLTSHPRLRWTWTGVLVWIAGNLLGPGLVLSDLTDQDGQPGPLSAILPYPWELPLVGVLTGTAFLGLILALGSLVRLRS